MSAQAIPASPSPDGDITRRDFIHVVTGAFAAVGAAFAVWPFIDQMNPSVDVLAAGSPVAIDLASLAPGQQITVLWRGKPMFIVNRTTEALKELKDPKLLAQLRDPDCAEHQQPDYAKNWSRSIKPEYLVLVGICTHLGCIPNYKPEPVINGNEGYFCPCHGSKYDLAGRVYQGVPAPYNLPVPPYRFEGDDRLIIGENHNNESYSLNEIVQM
ncbi:MAG: ubiquinol-cytochrome c reductase iron-sulfur subunit [Parvibaculum sp.]